MRGKSRARQGGWKVQEGEFPSWPQLLTSFPKIAQSHRTLSERTYELLHVRIVSQGEEERRIYPLAPSC